MSLLYTHSRSALSLGFQVRRRLNIRTATRTPLTRLLSLSSYEHLAKLRWTAETGSRGFWPLTLVEGEEGGREEGQHRPSLQLHFTKLLSSKFFLFSYFFLPAILISPSRATWI